MKAYEWELLIKRKYPEDDYILYVVAVADTLEEAIATAIDKTGVNGSLLITNKPTIQPVPYADAYKL